MTAHPVIAIDGPSASGKGTVAQRVATRLGFHYLDSGAMYRLVGLAAHLSGIDPDDGASVASLAASLPVRFVEGDAFLDGVSVGERIREEDCSQLASRVAVHQGVRQALLKRQRDFCEAPGLVADGRDMASVVFPLSTLKVFLTASAEVRAERRTKQLMEKGLPANMQAILQDLQERDARDAARPVAPLQKEADARLLDTTAMSIDEAVDQVLAWWQAATARSS